MSGQNEQPVTQGGAPVRGRRGLADTWPVTVNPQAPESRADIDVQEHADPNDK